MVVVKSAMRRIAVLNLLLLCLSEFSGALKTALQNVTT